MVEFPSPCPTYPPLCRFCLLCSEVPPALSREGAGVSALLNYLMFVQCEALHCFQLYCCSWLGSFLLFSNLKPSPGSLTAAGPACASHTGPLVPATGLQRGSLVLAWSQEDTWFWSDGRATVARDRWMRFCHVVLALQWTSCMCVLCFRACVVRQGKDKPDLLCQNHAVVRGLFLSSARNFSFSTDFSFNFPSQIFYVGINAWRMHLNIGLCSSLNKP